MPRRNIFALALAVLVALPAAAYGETPAAVAPLRDADTPMAVEPAAKSTVIAQSPTCASDCQAQHNRCRVQTKGSSACDAERQRCLEVCLQKKKN